MYAINTERLRESHEGPWLLLDLLMLAILLVNLFWIIFDASYGIATVRQGMAAIAPELVENYSSIHSNFALIDLGFIAIYLSEFFLRWLVAVLHRDYLRWYFFPIVHWYDLVGCIPYSFTRLFRFLRIFSILYRLHKYQVIDLTDSALLRFLGFYSNVFVEEISDRVVLKVLSDAQQDIADGTPLFDNIAEQVLAPRREILSHWVAAILVHMGKSMEHEVSGRVVREHVENSVGKAIADHPGVSALKRIPFLRDSIEENMEQAVTDIVNRSVINLLTDVTPDKVRDFIDHGVTGASDKEKALDEEVLLIVNECIDLLKEHLSRKRWQEELRERDALKAVRS